MIGIDQTVQLTYQDYVEFKWKATIMTLVFVLFWAAMVILFAGLVTILAMCFNVPVLCIVFIVIMPIFGFCCVAIGGILEYQVEKAVFTTFPTFHEEKYGRPSEYLIETNKSLTDNEIKWNKAIINRAISVFIFVDSMYTEIVCIWEYIMTHRPCSIKVSCCEKKEEA